MDVGSSSGIEHERCNGAVSLNKSTRAFKNVFVARDFEKANVPISFIA